MYTRNILKQLKEALDDTPAVLINGARQTGKSTLCKKLLEDEGFQGAFVSMDDPAVLSAAQSDPLGFLEDLGEHVIIDEVQRAPDLFLSMKYLIDKNRKSRRYVLTGSANVMMLPKVGDSLAGRIEIHKLWPLSQDELDGRVSQFLETLIGNKKFSNSNIKWPEIAERMMLGGYPESLERSSLSRRDKWFADYILAVLQKDITDLARIEGLSELPNILKLISARVGSTVNVSSIARLSGVKNTTLKRYINLLEHIFLIIQIPAWTKNLEGEFVKSSKMYLNDSGLLCHLLGHKYEEALMLRANAGAVLENFIVLEIIKQLSWSGLYLKPYHFSLHKGSEVDLVLEDRAGNIYGIEIKSAASITSSDFKGLKQLSKISGKKFRRGIVLYTGEQYLGGFGENLHAVPLSAVWLS
jgi:predicted AAA+ superfamily ATPase